VTDVTNVEPAAISGLSLYGYDEYSEPVYKDAQGNIVYDDGTPIEADMQITSAYQKPAAA
jgi:hypothetical protein